MPFLTFGNETKPDLLNSISKLLNARDKVAGSFEQRKIISVLPKPLLSKGQFQFDRATQLIWQVNEPVQSRLIFDKQGIRQNQHGRQVWQASNKKPGVALIGRILKAVLSTDWPVLRSYFSIAGKIQKNEWRLKLTPKDEALKKKVISITMVGEKYLQQMIIFEVKGDRTELTFNIVEP